MHANAETIRTRIYLQMSPAQKWDEVFRLRELAWTIKAAAIRKQYPDWSEQDVNSAVKKIFLYAFT